MSENTTPTSDAELKATVDKLLGVEPKKSPEPNVPAITMQPVESSQIEAIGYDEATATLAIRFLGKGEKPGQTYHYRNVGPTDWAALRDAPSPGSHLFRFIKPFPERYPYTRVGEAPVA